MKRRRAGGWWMGALLVVGCSKGAALDTGNSFGQPTTTQNATGGGDSTSAGSTSSSGFGTGGISATGGISGAGTSAGLDTAAGSTSGANTTGADAGSTSGANASTGGAMTSLSGGTSSTSSTSSTTSTSTTSTSGTTGSAAPGQPAAGMWADCDANNFANCTFAAPICINVDDPNLGTDGFCSAENCMNPATDCAPVPSDSNAPAICVQALDSMSNMVTLCAMDCSSGQTCPGGMVCIQNISFGMGLPVYSMCM